MGNDPSHILRNGEARKPLRERRHSETSGALSVLLFVSSILCLSGCGNGDWSDRAVRESQKRGNAIVIALEQFKSDQGEYPQSLAELIPDYLVEIEQPIAGTQPWQYKRNTDGTGTGFSLAFGDGSDFEPVSWYNPGAPRATKGVLPDWSLDTK